jgi:hypothetical protein
VSVPSSELAPPSLSQASMPPRRNKGGTRSPADDGVGGPNSDDCMEKRLCPVYFVVYTVSGRVCPQYSLGCLCGFCSIAPWTCLSTKDCAAPGRVCLQKIVLHLYVSVCKSFCAAPGRVLLYRTWTCLFTRACVAPVRVCRCTGTYLST